MSIPTSDRSVPTVRPCRFEFSENSEFLKKYSFSRGPGMDENLILWKLEKRHGRKVGIGTRYPLGRKYGWDGTTASLRHGFVVGGGEGSEIKTWGA